MNHLRCFKGLPRRGLAATIVAALVSGLFAAMLTQAGPAAAAVASDPNLLVNGSFEGSESSPGPTPGWRMGNGRSSAYTGTAVDGSYFADFVPIRSGGFIYQDVSVSVPAGSRFLMSIWLRSGTGPTRAAVAMYGNLNGSGRILANARLSTSWTRVTLQMPVTRATSTVRLQIAGSANTHINLDGASVTWQLLANGGFDSAARSPGLTPGWTVVGASRAAWTGAAQNGRFYADMVAGRRGGSMYQDVRISGGVGQIYQASIWYRTGGSGSLALFGNKNATGAASVGFGPSSAWKQVTVSLALRAKTTTLRLQVYGKLRTHLVLDSALLTPSSPAPQRTPAPVSTSRYPRDLTGAARDALLMRGRGAVDASNNASGHAYLQLLDIGGQDQARGGVLLSATSRFLTYAQLVSAIKNYVDGYAARQLPGAPAIIAIGTNNDMIVSAATGRSWAVSVVNPIVSYAHRYPGITIMGANDIEPGFAAGVASSRAWLSGFLAATPARFVFNGSADGCAWTAINGRCNNGWRASDLYWLSAGAAPARILSLPQIYNNTMAQQWKYISLTGVAGGGARVNFAGPLTEYTACAQAGSCFSLSGHAAWSALWNQINSDRRTAQPSLTYSTDLRIN